MGTLTPLRNPDLILFQLFDVCYLMFRISAEFFFLKMTHLICRRSFDDEDNFVDSQAHAFGQTFSCR